jgi:hypothetical protein
MAGSGPAPSPEGPSAAVEGDHQKGPPALMLFDTRTKKTEVFRPLVEGKVGMYVCGVTPYDFSHIGHARAYVSFDVLYRYALPANTLPPRSVQRPSRCESIHHQGNLQSGTCNARVYTTFKKEKGLMIILIHHSVDVHLNRRPVNIRSSITTRNTILKLADPYVAF